MHVVRTPVVYGSVIFSLLVLSLTFNIRRRLAAITESKKNIESRRVLWEARHPYRLEDEIPSSLFGIKSVEEVLMKDLVIDETVIGVGTFATIKPLPDNKYVMNTRLVAKHLKSFNSIDKFFASAARLNQECEFLRRLNNKHIPKCYGSYKIVERRFAAIILDWLPGKDLVDVVNESELNRESAVAAMYQLFEVLAYLHGENVIHGDVKPENILWDERQKMLYLVDFGLSALGPKIKGFSGTAMWLAPEVVRSNEILIQSDIWSAGLVVYSLAVDAGPFLFDEDEALIIRKLEKMKQIPWSFIDMEPFIKTVLSNSVVIKPSRRWNAARLAAVLRQYVVVEETETLDTTLYH